MPQKKNKDGYFRSTFVIGKTEDGKPKRVIIRGKTKKEHDEKLAEAKRLYSKGVSLSEVTVCEWGQRWLTIYKVNASPESQKMYRARLKIDINPAIGNMPIKEVRASHLQELLNNCAGKKGTVSKTRMTIKQLFDATEDEGLIDRNPSRKIVLPENLEETLRRPLTKIECDAFWRVGQTHPSGAYVLTMLLCGLRRGECLGLCREHIDLENHKLLIRQAVLYRTNQGRVKDPKSAAGIREVPIPEILLPFLQRQCTGKKEGGFIFTKIDGSRATEIVCKNWWRSFMRHCHIEADAKLYRNKVLLETSPIDNSLTPHYLRHTYSTDIYAAGIDEKAQKYFLGHASRDVTDIYRKMSDEAFNRAAEILNLYFNKKYGIVHSVESGAH